jgi:hypothetical protein
VAGGCQRALLCSKRPFKRYRGQNAVGCSVAKRSGTNVVSIVVKGVVAVSALGGVLEVLAQGPGMGEG